MGKTSEDPLKQNTETNKSVAVSESTLGFVLECMKENLAHSRHVESEIHAFSGIYMAIVAGFMAFAYTKSGEEASIELLVLNIVIILGGIIAFCLLRRWYRVFDNHKDRAEKNYRTLVNCYFAEGSPERDIFGGNMPEDLLGDDSLYIFKHPKKNRLFGTRQMIYAFNIITILGLFLLLYMNISDLFFGGHLWFV